MRSSVHNRKANQDGLQGILSMSKKSKGLDVSVRIVFLILLGFLTLFLSLIFLAVFVAVASWFLWRQMDLTKDLEARVSALEGPSEKKPDKE